MRDELGMGKRAWIDNRIFGRVKEIGRVGR